jgi:MFS transporter, DHA2 family, multidrug resistance protein
MTVDVIALSNSGRRQAAIALMIATAMQAFDSTIANVALPQLEQSLGGGIDLGSWVMTSYLCAAAVMATLTGWFRRRYGARQAFGGAIALFVFASLLCSISPSQTALILFRLVQGAAAGIIQPLAQAILLDLYPKKHHGRLLAIWGATIMAGPIMGPILGGVITDLASWAVDLRFEHSSRSDCDPGAGPGSDEQRTAQRKRPYRQPRYSVPCSRCGRSSTIS